MPYLIVGVLDLKNSGDWAIEKWSIRNKKDYAARHGIALLHDANSCRLRINCQRHEAQKKVCSRMERIVGENGYYQRCNASVPSSRMVLVVGSGKQPPQDNTN